MVILKFNYWVAIIHLKSHCLITLLMASPVLGNDVRITDDTTPNLPNAGGHPAQHCSGPTRGGGLTYTQAALYVCHGRLCISSHIHAELQNWGRLLYALTSQTTNLQEIIPTMPSWHVTHDACHQNLWAFSGAQKSPPYLWRAHIPPVSRPPWFTASSSMTTPAAIVTWESLNSQWECCTFPYSPCT